jgi:hypothetical protein
MAREVTMSNIRWSTVLALVAVGCSNSSSGGKPDLRVGGTEDAGLADLSTSDLSVENDLAVASDLSVESDLAAPDLSMPDIAMASDLAMSVDMAVAADMAMAADMTVPPDLNTADLLNVDLFTPCTAPPGAFRLRGPISTARVTSQKPRVEWFASAQAYSYDVDFCTDRTCAVKQTVNVPSSAAPTLTAQPSTSLARGARFWRVTAKSDCGTTPSSSGVWEIFVGGRSATVNTAHLGFGFMDTNQDRRVDVAARSYSGSGWFYLNGVSGLSSSQGQLVASPAAPVASVGDVNGDGFGDLLAHNQILPGANVAAGLGSALSGTFDNGAESNYGAGIGDFDGDGYGDFAIFRGLNGDSSAGTGKIFFGSSADTLAADGDFVVGAGDVNGDGIADVAIAQSYYGVAGTVKIYHGGSRTLPVSPATTLNRPGGESAVFGAGIAGACDVNGDGYADLIVGTSTNYQVYVYYGSASGIQTTGFATLTASGSGIGASRAVACAGDVNGDGYDDVVVGDPYGGVPSSGRTSGRILVFHGGSGGISTTAATTIDSTDDADFGSSRYGAAVAGLGDVNNDGYDDIAVGAIQCDSKLIIFGGSATGINKSTPLYTFSGPGDICFAAEIAQLERAVCEEPRPRL